MSTFSAADASAITQAQVRADVQIAVAKKMQDHQKQQGQAALSLLDAAAKVSTPPAHPGKGLNLDAIG